MYQMVHLYHMVHIKVEGRTDAPVERVWALLADAADWQRWSSFDESWYERPGAADPHGIGAIRRFRTGRSRSREEVVAFEAPTHLAYTLLEGLPLEGYRADVRLSPTSDGGTGITWESSFEGRVPGTGRFYGLVLRVFIGRLVKELVSEAERAARDAVPERN
jgi:uncharacterized protein YndB with AHSA1/START domain